MTRVFVTGSADGLGRAAAQALQEGGYEVVVHVRSTQRLDAVRDLLDHGAEAVVGNLSDVDETRDVADQVNRLGRVDATIHNAGVIRGPHVLPVNVVEEFPNAAAMSLILSKYPDDKFSSIYRQCHGIWMNSLALGLEHPRMVQLLQTAFNIAAEARKIRHGSSRHA